MVSHSFAICAYKENPFLEESIKSLLNQTVQSSVYLVTSTPNEAIQRLADQYSLPLYVNKTSNGIASDWSFAYACADTEYVTLAHQDDFYEPDYAKQIQNAAEKYPDSIILFSDYTELRSGEKVCNTLNLRIKRLMNRTMSLFPCSVQWKKMVLSFGCCICCPSVTYHKRKIGEFSFDSNLYDCLDWEAYLRLSRQKGRFVYLPGKLISHRIYEGSTTTSAISDGCRDREEQNLFRSLWPKPVACVLSRLYRKAQKSNNIES